MFYFKFSPGDYFEVFEIWYSMLNFCKSKYFKCFPRSSLFFDFLCLRLCELSPVKDSELLHPQNAFSTVHIKRGRKQDRSYQGKALNVSSAF